MLSVEEPNKYIKKTFKGTFPRKYSPCLSACSDGSPRLDGDGWLSLAPDPLPLTSILKVAEPGWLRRQKDTGEA